MICVQSMAGCLAVHEADPTDDSEFAGVLGNVLERNADQALRTIVDLRSTKGKKSPLTVAELRAMAVTCKNAVDFDTDDGTLAFVRLFANEADAYFREVQESA